MKKMIKKAVLFFAILSLLAAYVGGGIIRKDISMRELYKRFPDTTLDKYKGKNIFNAKVDGESIFWLALKKQQGWGGPFNIALSVNSESLIEGVHVLDHTETPSFFRYLVSNGFFDQFKGMKTDGEFIPDGNIDTVSGATISSVAFTRAVRSAGRDVGNSVFEQNIPEESRKLSVSLSEYLLIFLFAAVIFLRLMKYNKLRIPVMVISMVFIGFIMNRSVSASYFASVMLGFFPSFYEQPVWWILMGGVLGTALIMSMNLYCYWMCPFGAMQELITKAGGFKFRLPQKYESFLKQAVYFFLWAALMVSFISGKPSAVSYEPFSTLFSLRGLAVQWYLVSAAVVMSFFIPRFWCRFFCPAGACINILVSFRKKMGLQLKKLRGQA